MPVPNVEIQPYDIDFTEKTLLPSDQCFDDERRHFIQNLQTIDLQAVPGSGKTTALLAKLLILEKYLPFDDGSGILVISHTNAAVDEIKNKIGKICVKLFSYPNFVGTIQSFVDQFLAIPFYSHKYSKEHIRIDNEIYEELTYEPSRARGWLKHRPDAKEILYQSRLIGEDALAYISSDKEFPLRNKDSASYQSILNMKLELRKQGMLSFDEAYSLAREYLAQFPRAKIIIQKRFSYIFVDEMQDMNQLQYRILEQLFFDNGKSISVFQRIGDKNQAIFNGEAIIEQVWTDRKEVLELKGSFRLTPQNANIVQSFGLNSNEIDGRRKYPGGSEITIKPRIIVFSDDSICDVIPKFADIIKSLQLSGEIPAGPGQIFKAIGWVKKLDNAAQFGICDYYPKFSIDTHAPPIDYSTLESYLRINVKGNETLEALRKSILNALLKILRMEHITDTDKRNYTKRKMINLLKDEHPDYYEEFKLKIYQWSIGIIRGHFDNVLSEVREHIPAILSYFGSSIGECHSFVNNKIEKLPSASVGPDISISSNIYSDDDIEIEVTTIHSSKGQTHTATLYLETSYHSKYESERLCNCFCGHDHGCSLIRDIQSIRMAYVGLSRPTHLLCFAVHKDRFKAHLGDLDKSVWEIIDIC